MNFFANNPFIKVLGFWITGLLIAKYIPALLTAFSLLFLAGIIWLAFLFRKQKYPFNIVAFVLLGTTLLLLSALNFKLQHSPLPQTSGHKSELLATVLENPQEKTNSYQTVLKIIQSENDSLNGYQVLAWLQKDSSMLKLQAGEQVFAETTIRNIENTGNPFEFDYKTYRAQQGIYFRCYISKNSISPTGYHRSSLKIRAESVREKLLQQLRSGLAERKSFEVISALTLGYRKELSPETRESFTSTGAMHVLAVSGLHVGLIFLFLLWAFRFLNFVKGGKWLRLICISAILWMYALITGFSPSVQRAVTMFTFLLIAETLNRRNSIYNSIAASAFALLLVNPDILFAVGFQLSYAAVLSIVYFYPMLVKLLPAQQVVLQKPWQLLCVSLAAQIGTFPLSLYYFNQFPVYFWLSNFIVIPAAFILLCGTFLFFITSALPPLNQLIAQLLDIINSGVLFLLKKISMLPGAVIDHIAISGQELISLIAIILFIILFISSRRARYLQLSLLCFLSFQLFGVQKKLKLFNQHRFISYKNTNRTFHFIDGRKNYILSEDTSQLSPYLYSNVITRLQLDPPVILPIADTTSYATTDFILEGSICQFGDQSFELDTLKGNKHIPLSGNPSVKPQTSSNKNLFIYNTK